MQVLDKGFVHLLDIMGSEADIAASARVCTGTQCDPEKDERLLRYLYQNGHTTPLEMMEFRFHVKAPIFVARQWMRHRTWTYNEASQRYKKSPCEFYVPDGLSNDAKQDLQYHYDSCFFLYEAMLGEGIEREQARIVLPLATYTEFVAKVDLNNLLKFLEQRLHPRAQWEIRQYAKEIGALIKPYCPVIWGCFSELHKEGNV